MLNQSKVFALLLKLSEYRDMLTHYEPLAVSSDNPGLKGAFSARLAFLYFNFGSFDKAIQTFSKAVELCEAGGNVEDAAFCYTWLAWCHQFKDDFELALALKEQGLAKIREPFNLELYGRIHCCSTVAYACLGRWDEALGEARKALKVAEEYSDNSLICFTALQFVNTYVWKRDIDNAIEYAELAVQRAPTPADKAWAQSYLAWVWCHAGDPGKGVDILAKSVEILHRAGAYATMALPAMGRLLEGYLLAGKYDEAKQTGEELVDLAELYGAGAIIVISHRHLGEVALETNPEEAVPHFEKAISICRKIKAENELALAYSGLGRYHKQQGNVAEARKYLTDALEIFERLGTLIEPDKVRKELAHLPKSA